jgi:hypothetical protein
VANLRCGRGAVLENLAFGQPGSPLIIPIVFVTVWRLFR